jgi:hypothetical protein
MSMLIISPINNKNISLNSVEGFDILKKYIKQFTIQSGGYHNIQIGGTVNINNDGSFRGVNKTGITDAAFLNFLNIKYQRPGSVTKYIQLFQNPFDTPRYYNQSIYKVKIRIYETSPKQNSYKVSEIQK